MWQLPAIANLRPIYERVGGNPLAIRLVVGQLHVHALDTVLADLLEVRADEASALYSYLSSSLGTPRRNRAPDTVGNADGSPQRRNA